MKSVLSKRLFAGITLSFFMIVGLVLCLPQPSKMEPYSSPTPSPASAPTSNNLTVLSKIEGNVSIMESGANAWSEAQVGMSLESDDTIKTGANSLAVITFFEGSTIELQADTEIRVSELITADGTGPITIKLWQGIGKTRSWVQKLIDPASRYEIDTPAGSAVVRGSIGDVYVFNDRMEIYNIEGIWCAEAQNRRVCMDSGYNVTIGLGQPPNPPVPTSQTSRAYGSS